MTRRIIPRSLIALVPILFVLSGIVSSRADEKGRVTVTLEAGTVDISEVNNGAWITVDGFGRRLVPGLPDLPAKVFAIAIPPGAVIRDVSFEPAEAEDLPGRHIPVPASLPRVTGEEDPACYARDRARYTANHASVYGRDVTYPEKPAEFLGRAGYRKYHLVEVRFRPVAWHAGEGRLTFTPRVTVHVDYSVPGVLPDDVVLVDTIPRCEDRARKLMVNFDQARTWYPAAPPAPLATYDYVIITTNPLVQAVKPLVDWETAKGRSVKVVTVSWIYMNYSGYDLAQRMRNFLRDKYPSGEWGIRDVLLAGHYDDVPMRRVYQDVGYGMPETDFYYAELSYPDNQSWDADGDLKWAEDYDDPIDFYGEINVGRIPWSDPETVEKICRKSVRYEMNVDPAFKRSMLCLGAFFWPDTDAAVLMELKTDPANNAWMADWDVTKGYEKNNDYTSIYDCDFPLMERTMMTEAWMKRGYGFVNWGGHGNPEGCHISGMGSAYFVVGSDAWVLDDDYPAVVFANACSNADTDALNIGQRLIKNGAAGFLGATKVSFGTTGWSHPHHGCGSSMDYFFTQAYTSGNYTLGEALNFAVSYMYQNGLFYYVYYETLEWASVWGQPDLGLETKGPITICDLEGKPDALVLPGFEAHLTFRIKPGLDTYAAGTGYVHYRHDPAAAFERAPIASLGGDLYEVRIPPTSPGTVTEFHLIAESTGGEKVCLPFDAPLDTFTYTTGFEVNVVEHGFEQEEGWTVINENVSSGAFVRAAPGSTSAQPDEDHTTDGTQCYVTGPAAGSLGQDDLDGGPTRLVSPAFDVTGDDVHAGFWIWHHTSSYGIQQPMTIEVSNDDGVTWVLVEAISHAPGWHRHTFRVAEQVTPSAQVRFRISATDEPNDDVVEALVDDFHLYRLLEESPLWAETYEIPVSTGGRVPFTLAAGPAHADQVYLLLGSASGMEPGIPLPGGAVLPLNWDAFTRMVLNLLHTPYFTGFSGVLDGTGRATAQLDTRGPLSPSLVGSTLCFAYMIEPVPYFASNGIEVTFVP